MRNQNLRPNTQFVNLIESEGFRNIENDSEHLKYYTNEESKLQVRIDEQEKEIGLLSPEGNVLYVDKTVDLRTFSNFLSGNLKKSLEGEYL